MKRIITLLIIVVVLSGFFWFWVPKAGGVRVAHAAAASSTSTVSETIPGYFIVTDSCNWAWQGSCVNIRTGPGVSYKRASVYLETKGPQIARVRNGQVFFVTDLVKGTDGRTWLKIGIDRGKIAFPDRILGDWYVAADYFQPVQFSRIAPERDAVKLIKVVLHEQKLYAYEGDKVVMSTKVSTGRDDIKTSTVTGHFHVFAKYPMKVMEGPLKGLADEYTLFVPFSMAFYRGDIGTAFIHSAYWHDSFGEQHSHGCVNLSPKDAEWLYNWTPDPSVRQIPVTVVP